MPPFAADSWVKEAMNSIVEAAEACFAKDLTRAVRKSRKLVGLGWGLTPSGDDFLGGLLFAAHVLQKIYPQHIQSDRKIIKDSIKSAHEQTNPISHALLSDLALGRGPEPLHDLVNALIMDKDPETVMTRVIRLIEIGSTSGWDMLSGLMTGMLLIEDRVN
jgi:hypothetical protein